MPLNTGARLGPYTILAPLGAGGMGEVYRAHDTRLNRDVALKVLPEIFARDPERMARFTREAQILASLNHPNIAQLYGLEESEGLRALVMEYVPGDTLHGPLPVEDAVNSPARLPTPSNTPTTAPSSTATSSPPTSRSPRKARSRSSTSAWPKPSTTTPPPPPSRPTPPP